MPQVRTFLVIFVMLSAHITQCEARRLDRVAKYSQQTLTSPNYPNPYPASEDNHWIIQKGGGQNNDYAIQLVFTDFDIGDCNGDYLKILEGATFGSVVEVKNWCESGTKEFTASEVVVVLQFVTDAKDSGRGFSVDYGIINKPMLECEASGQGLVKVGVSPVVAAFKGQRNIQSCQWVIQEQDIDPKSRLVMELVIPSDLSCEHGRFILYEGDKAEGHINYEYCKQKQPFSKIYLGTNVAVLKFQSDGEIDPSDFVVKISQVSKESADCSGVEIEVAESPVFFSLPFVTTGNGNGCPVKVMAKDQGMHLRIDALGTNEGITMCDDALLSVQDMEKKLVGGFCNRNINPVHFAETGEVVVRQASKTPVFLRAAAVVAECDNSVMPYEAVQDLDQTLMIPDQNEYRKYVVFTVKSLGKRNDLGRCMRRISAPSDKELIYMKIKWTPPQFETGYPSTTDGLCDGDFISVYDGQTEQDPLLYSSCSNGQRKGVDTTIVSSRDNVLVVLDADERIPGNQVSLEYHAIPAGKVCEKNREIKVTRTPQEIMSHNYPNPLPLNQRCLYDLVSDKDERIVVKVLEANLPDHCETMLMVYEGQYTVQGKSKSTGKICGNKKTGIFYIDAKVGTLLSVSDETVSPGGWKLQVYTVEGDPDVDVPSGNSGNKADWTCHVNLVLLLAMLIAGMWLR